MPRTVQEILDHADKLAAQFESYEPDAADVRDTQTLDALRDAVIARSEAERTLAETVRRAHDAGYSWRSIGSLLGTSGEAVRQRYGTGETDSPGSGRRSA